MGFGSARSRMVWFGWVRLGLVWRGKVRRVVRSCMVMYSQVRCGILKPSIVK